MCNVHCLLYADDIALIAASEEDLQNMLSILENRCRKWGMKVNSIKSNILHARPCRIPKASYLFVFNMDVIEIVPRYKYLGIVLHEMLGYSVTGNVLADSGGRALESLYTKFRNNKVSDILHIQKCLISAYRRYWNASRVFGLQKVRKSRYRPKQGHQVTLGSPPLYPKQSNQWRYGLDTSPDKEAREHLAFMEPHNWSINR